LRVTIKLSDNDNLTINFCKGVKHFYKQLQKYENNKEINMSVTFRKFTKETMMRREKALVPVPVPLVNMLEPIEKNITYNYMIKLPTADIEITVGKNKDWPSYLLQINLLNKDLSYYNNKILIEKYEKMSFSDFVAMAKLTCKSDKDQFVGSSYTYTTYYIGDKGYLVHEIFDDESEKYSIEALNLIKD